MKVCSVQFLGQASHAVVEKALTAEGRTKRNKCAHATEQTQQIRENRRCRQPQQAGQDVDVRLAARGGAPVSRRCCEPRLEHGHNKRTCPRRWKEGGEEEEEDQDQEEEEEEEEEEDGQCCLVLILRCCLVLILRVVWC
jgi:hypothetical protein